MSKSDASEDARIAAWRAERARIAAADKAARVAQRKADQAQEALNAEAERKTAAVEFLRSVPNESPRKTNSPVYSALDSHLSVGSGVAPAVGPVSKPVLAATPRPPRRAVARAHPNKGFGTLFLATVLAPMLVVLVYLFAFATPLYEAQSVVTITKSSDTSSGSRAGLLGAMERPTNLQDVFRAETFIRSRTLMDALESDLAFVTTLSSDVIDPIKRLRDLPALSMDAHAQFDRFVTASVDVQSGQLTVFVRAADRDMAIAVSQAVLHHAETQITALDQTLFDARQSHAVHMRKDAETQLEAAQTALVALQVKYQEVDPKNRVENIYGRIKGLEDEAQQLQNEIQKAQIAGVGANRQTEKALALQAQIRSQIEEERATLVSPNGATGVPLNNLLMEYELARLDVDLAREAVKSAIDAQADAGREAALNRSLFQVVVPPNTAENTVYPKVPGSVALSLLLCLALFAAIRSFLVTRH